MSTLKAQLRTDLTAAMKARDELVKSTLRMTLTAIGNAEVAGAEARELSDDEVLKVFDNCREDVEREPCRTSAWS